MTITPTMHKLECDYQDCSAEVFISGSDGPNAARRAARAWGWTYTPPQGVEDGSMPAQRFDYCLTHNQENRND